MDAAVDAGWPSENSLRRVFGWYLLKDRLPEARRFVTGLYAHFGGQFALVDLCRAPWTRSNPHG
ncbi:MAG: hypothetical protein R2703_02220 [Micropruina glycogenica]